jgi:hypothetical protein
MSDIWRFIKDAAFAAAAAAADDDDDDEYAAIY